MSAFDRYPEKPEKGKKDYLDMIHIMEKNPGIVTDNNTKKLLQNFLPKVYEIAPETGWDLPKWAKKLGIELKTPSKNK